MKTRTELWAYKNTLGADQRNWVGYQVHATDGDIGKIDEMTTETGRGSVVVDTGFWIFGKKRLLPAASVTSVDHDAQKVNVALTKEQIKNAPDYEEMRRDDTSYYDTSADYYGRYI